MLWFELPLICWHSGILRGQQFRAKCGPGEPVLQLQSLEGGWSQSSTQQFPEGGVVVHNNKKKNNDDNNQFFVALCSSHLFKNTIFWHFLVWLCAQVLELEGEKGEWGFKALKQMIKINFKLVCSATYAIICLCHQIWIFKQCFCSVFQLCRPTFQRWWTGTSSSSHTSEVLSPGTTQRSPSTPFWTTSLPPNRYGSTML